MSIFQQGVNLTPAQRAMLKMLKGTIIALIITGMDAAAQYLASGNLNTIRWSQVALVALIAMLVALGHSLEKYASAHGDAPLGAFVDTAMQGVAADLSKGLETPAAAPQVVIQTSAEPAPIVLTRGNTPPPASFIAAAAGAGATMPDQMAEAGPQQTPA